MARVRVLLVYAASVENATVSYHHAWPRHFQAHARFRCTPVNLLDRRMSARAGAYLISRAWRGDAVVLLHSTFSNACMLDGRLFEAVCALRQPKTFFIGNEYKLMPEKMRFCEALPVSMLITQTRNLEVHRLYRERLGCHVVGLPNTGLDTCLFRPTTLSHERPIDLGYRAYGGPPYLGHREREALAEFFLTDAPRRGLRVDISLDPEARLGEADWAGFLNRCKGQLGSEAGGDYFELTDATRNAVNAFLKSNPNASFDEIRTRFFDGYGDSVPMRIISGRNIEAAGTKTVQVLFDGHYDGYLEPDAHYIPMRKDFSNAEDAMAKFRDTAYCQTMTANAYDLATRELTYERLIDRFADALAPVL